MLLQRQGGALQDVLLEQSAASLDFLVRYAVGPHLHDLAGHCLVGLAAQQIDGQIPRRGGVDQLDHLTAGRLTLLVLQAALQNDAD